MSGKDIFYGALFGAFVFVIITLWEVQQTLPV
jgi:hypothetical protein